MDITVKGLKHPHRYVLDAAQTHIYMLMKKVGRASRVCAGKSSRPEDLDAGEGGACGGGRKSSRQGYQDAGKGERVEVAGSPPVPGTGMRGKGERVEVALLPLGAELPAGSPTCRRAGPSLYSRAVRPGRSSC